ncbi:MAG: helix-turn-helix domain-containing protein [Aggregatilineales bacterium]
MSTVRKLWGLTQRELGRRWGLSEAMIQKYETGVHDPTMMRTGTPYSNATSVRDGLLCSGAAPVILPN